LFCPSFKLQWTDDSGWVDLWRRRADMQFMFRRELLDGSSPPRWLIRQAEVKLRPAAFLVIIFI
jgi:hypothetical protein